MNKENMNQPNFEHSCIDCGTAACHYSDKSFPEFCLSKNLEEEVYKDALSCYEDEYISKVTKAAAEVEFEHYCQYTRVQEVMAFANKMGFKKIGIATCIGLLRESRTLAKILRSNGFEVYGMGCKAGMTPKTKLGIDERCNGVGVNACNPILQAKMLNHMGTELNVVVGLCVGHDAMFNKYSDALVTTLVAKDRVLGNNPAAALYTAETYYKLKLFGDK